MPDAQGYSSFFGNFIQGFMGETARQEQQKLQKASQLMNVAQMYQRQAERDDIDEDSRQEAARGVTKTWADIDKTINQKSSGLGGLMKLFGIGKKVGDTMVHIPTAMFTLPAQETKTLVTDAAGGVKDAVAGIANRVAGPFSLTGGSAPATAPADSGANFSMRPQGTPAPAAATAPSSSFSMSPGATLAPPSSTPASFTMAPAPQMAPSSAPNGSNFSLNRPAAPTYESSVGPNATIIRRPLFTAPTGVQLPGTTESPSLTTNPDANAPLPRYETKLTIDPWTGLNRVAYNRFQQREAILNADDKRKDAEQQRADIRARGISEAQYQTQRERGDIDRADRRKRYEASPAFALHTPAQRAAVYSAIEADIPYHEPTNRYDKVETINAQGQRVRQIINTATGEKVDETLVPGSAADEKKIQARMANAVRTGHPITRQQAEIDEGNEQLRVQGLGLQSKQLGLERTRLLNEATQAQAEMAKAKKAGGLNPAQALAYINRAKDNAQRRFNNEHMSDEYTTKAAADAKLAQLQREYVEGAPGGLPGSYTWEELNTLSSGKPAPQVNQKADAWVNSKVPPAGGRTAPAQTAIPPATK